MKLLTIIAFIFYGLTTGLSNPPANDPCGKLKVESKIKNTSNSLQNGEVEVMVVGGTKPYKYIFFNENGYPLSEDNDSNILKNRGIGVFFCTVVDNEGCQKKIKIEIK